MIKKKAFKFRLSPTLVQRHLFCSFAGSCRFVYNRALSQRLEIYEKEQRSLSLFDQNNELAQLKKEEETSWLRDIHSQILQQSLANLDQAFKNFFRRVRQKEKPGFPKYKKRGFSDSFRYPQGVKVDDNRIFLPKIGWVRYIKSRDIEGRIKQTTIRKDGDHWFVSVQTEIACDDLKHPSESSVGIDLGVARFATLSNGESIEALNSFKSLEGKLALAQRELSRKKKFSSNWKKQKRKIGNIHRKIRNSRHDFLHKTSTAISKNHALVVMEDLDVQKMTESPRGTQENPGKNIKVKSRFNRSMLDQGWHTFRSFLGYKLEWLGGKLELINPKNTSRMCTVCGHVARENRPSQAIFLCKACGHEDHADLNAAINILRAGLAQFACGEKSQDSSLKQEPLAAVVS